MRRRDRQEVSGHYSERIDELFFLALFPLPFLLYPHENERVSKTLLIRLKCGYNAIRIIMIASPVVTATCKPVANWKYSQVLASDGCGPAVITPMTRPEDDCFKLYANVYLSVTETLDRLNSIPKVLSGRRPLSVPQGLPWLYCLISHSETLHNSLLMVVYC